MDRLKAVPYVDVAGISIKLDQADRRDRRAAAREGRTACRRRDTAAPLADDPAWVRFLRDLWNDLRSVIRVEVSDRPAAPLMHAAAVVLPAREPSAAPAFGAPRAAVEHDERAFRADLQAASGWLKQYFDLQSKPVQAALATLAQQSAVPMPGEMPDLAGSLDAVRTLKAVAERTPERAAAQAK